MTSDKSAEESAQEVAFRQEVRAWLKENLPRGWGTPEYESPERLSEESQQLGEEWTKKVYDAGYTGFNYPKEFGGIERPDRERRIIQQEMIRCGTPPGPMSQGLLMVGDALEYKRGKLGLPSRWFTADMAQAKDSVFRMAELDFDILCFSHFPPIRKNGSELLRRFADSLS